MFRDPYFLDFLGLKGAYSERDIEAAILRDMESFLLFPSRPHCVKYRKIDTDWGWCKSRESVYGGRIMFEHDTCSKWVARK